MRLESRLSLQQEVGWDRDTVRMARYLADVQEEPFVVTSLNNIQDQLYNWVQILPDIQPTFNVGSNHSEEVLNHLHHLNINFTVNNKQEISRMITLGLDTTSAVFSNPTKIASHIRAAQTGGVDTLFCDSVLELNKIKKNHPDARIVIQLCSEESLSDVEKIVRQSDRLGLSVVGLSYNMSSDCDVGLVKRAVELAWQFGCQLDQIHLSGMSCAGESTRGVTHLTSHLSSLASSLKEQGLASLGIAIYGDATEFLVGPSVTLAVKIVDVRKEISDDDNVMVYVINESVFGVFSSNLASTGDSPVSAPMPLGGGKNRKGLTARLLETNLHGNSGDDLDLVVDDVVLQKMEVEDWLLFPNMGSANLSEYTNTVRKSSGGPHIITVKAGGMKTATSGARPCPDLTGVGPDKTVVRGLDWELGDTFIYEGEE